MLSKMWVVLFASVQRVTLTRLRLYLIPGIAPLPGHAMAKRNPDSGQSLDLYRGLTDNASRDNFIAWVDY
eukprot:3564644-Pyramimonas_sp.AAC.1